MPIKRMRRDEAPSPVVEKAQPVLVDAWQLKALAMRYRLTQGQVRGLIAQHGLDEATLRAEAEKLRRR